MSSAIQSEHIESILETGGGATLRLLVAPRVATSPGTTSCFTFEPVPPSSATAKLHFDSKISPMPILHTSAVIGCVHSGQAAAAAPRKVVMHHDARLAKHVATWHRTDRRARRGQLLKVTATMCACEWFVLGQRSHSGIGWRLVCVWRQWSCRPPKATL
jgi:hypothetical protein